MNSPKPSSIGPRETRVLYALAKGTLSREQVDQIAGASNGPEVIRRIRNRGLEVPCTRLRKTDQDGKPCFPGYYRLTREDRRKVIALFRGKK